MVCVHFKLLLGPGIRESVSKPFKSRISIPYSPIGLLDVTLLVSKPHFWGLISLVQVPRVEVPHVGHRPLAPQGEALYL